MAMKSLEDLEKAFDRGLSSWERDIVTRRAAVMSTKVVREIKRETPVDTGLLRRTWKSEVKKVDGDVIVVMQNATEYAAHVNNGHRIVIHGKERGYKPGHHMLEKGIRQYQDIYMKDDLQQMIDDLNKAMRG